MDAVAVPGCHALTLTARAAWSESKANDPRHTDRRFMCEDRLDYPAALRVARQRLDAARRERRSLALTKLLGSPPVHFLAERQCGELQRREEALQRFLDEPYRPDSLRGMDRSDVDAIIPCDPFVQPDVRFPLANCRASERRRRYD